MKESEDRKNILGNDQVAASEVYKRKRTSATRVRASISQLLKIKRVKITLGSLLTLFILAGLTGMYYSWDHRLIVEGVKISGVNVSNLSEEQAKEKMDKEIQRLLEQTVKLKFNQVSHEITLGEFGLIITADSALQQAYEYGRTGLIHKKVLSKISASNGINLDLSQDWNEEVLIEMITKNFEDYNKQATDASFQITPQNTMIITSEQVGSVINTEDLIQKIKDIDVFEPVSEIIVDFKEQIPQLTAAQLENQKITGLLSTYTTRFDASQTARSENVRLAGMGLDGAIIEPNATLSFNQIVGRRTIEAGYKDAFVIINGQFVPGLAGGICQVSSTLYNTGLLANLSVTERSNHDLAISYVPLGQDAAVAYQTLDLKFLNDSGGYLLIRSKVSNNSITIELYGKVIPGQEVLISNTIASVIPAVVEKHVDETMAPGESRVEQEGQPGYIVNTTRTVKVNGQVVKTESLKQSRHQPLARIIAIGT